MALCILPLGYKILEVLFSCSSQVTKRLENFKNTVLYYNLYLRFFLEAFLELSIASHLRIRNFKMEILADLILSIYAAILLALLSIYMVGSVFFLKRNHKQI